MATKPKEIVSEAIDRAGVAMVPTSLKTTVWSNSNSSNETRVTHYIARVYRLGVGSFSLLFKRTPSQFRLFGLIFDQILITQGQAIQEARVDTAFRACHPSHNI